jgi:hypothetical protein
MNTILPTDDQNAFTMLYAPPPPQPIQIIFTLNRKEIFSRTDIDYIMGAFADLIRRDTKFMSKFTGIKHLNIAIVKNFHIDDQYDSIKQTEHINVQFYEDGKKGDTHHMYFTRNRLRITQMSKCVYERFEF